MKIVFGCDRILCTHQRHLKTRLKKGTNVIILGRTRNVYHHVPSVVPRVMGKKHGN